MYVMVDSFANVYPNFNQLYMAGLMTAPMIIIEVIFMSLMYQNQKWNIMIIVGSIFLLIGLWVLIRQQVAISDYQFLKSMIPHHAGAILMCEQAPLKDPEIKKLCQDIVKNQRQEINFMKAIEDDLETLENSENLSKEHVLRLVAEYNCQIVRGFPIPGWFFRSQHDYIASLWAKR